MGQRYTAGRRKTHCLQLGSRGDDDDKVYYGSEKRLNRLIIIVTVVVVGTAIRQNNMAA